MGNKDEVKLPIREATETFMEFVDRVYNLHIAHFFLCDLCNSYTPGCELAKLNKGLIVRMHEGER